MNVNIKQAYKDQNPIETIKQIKKTLKSLGIELKEEIFTVDKLSNIYSIRVTMKDLPHVGSNGKGTSLVYARASAYAEFIERLANSYIFGFSFDYAASFLYDAKKIKMSDFKKSPLLGHYRYSKTFFDDFLNTYNANSNDSYAVPFKSIDGKKTLWFPLPFYCLYGSNGMAAGNTYYEMSVQALSEILERYAISRILTKKDEPYVYDNNKLVKILPNLKPFFDDLKKQKYHVKVYDCSLNRKMPVFAVIVLNSDYTRYSVSFGSHPNANFAIERCFTEMFQGATDLHLKMSINEKAVIKEFNLREIIHNGCGVYSKEFLNVKTPSKNYDILYQRFSSNKEMYEYLLNIFKDNRMNLYYRDSSYLGLAVGQFIVPEYSFVSVPTKFHFQLLAAKRKYYFSILKFFDLNKTKQKDLFEILDLLENCNQRQGSTGIISKYNNINDFNFYLLMLIYASYLKDKIRQTKYSYLLHSISNNNNIKETEQIVKDLINYNQQELKNFYKKAKFSFYLNNTNSNKEFIYLKRLLKAQKQFYKVK